MIPPAQATGRFTLITGAMAREIIVGKDGKAEAVSYIDKATRTEKRIHARAFVVGRQRLRIGAPAAEFASRRFFPTASPILPASSAAT